MANKIYYKVYETRQILGSENLSLVEVSFSSYYNLFLTKEEAITAITNDIDCHGEYTILEHFNKI